MTGRRITATRIHILRYIFIAALAFAAFRILYIQLTKGEEYKQMAYDQYTTEITINPKRGAIYDRNMKEMALSVTAEDCILNPNKVRTNLTTAQANTLKNGLCEILELEPEQLEEHLSKQTNYRKIKDKVTYETAEKVRKFIDENDFEECLYFVDNPKRYYPGGTLASTVLGFTDYENKGVSGIEKQYENVLTGTPGRILTAKNAKMEEMPFKYESYIEAENGRNVVLTIDWTVQSVLEKHLEAALKDKHATNKVCGIVMDVNTCEVLAMASKPDFDPNNYSQFTDLALEFYDDYFRENKEAENDTDYLNFLWKNKTVTEPYEPGSTFKIVTSAMTLEENTVKPGETFYCSGGLNVAGRIIHCHKDGGHGVETFEQGLQNSCNPVFMTLAQKLGKYRFYDYYQAFGCTELTGIDLPAEAGSIYHSLKGFNDQELATYSFGQTFKVTPIRLLTTLCAVANGGKLMKPYIVKKLVDDDGNTIESFSPELVRSVNSQNTSDTIMTYLKNGIDIGSNINAYVKGYKVAAKTGTSQKRDKADGYYVSSCVSFVPADKPQIAILIVIDEPTVGSYYGGTVAAPVASAVLAEILPYLNIEQSYSEEEKNTLEVQTPSFGGMTVSEAKKSAEEKGFRTIVRGNGDVVNEQLPRYTANIPAGGTVVLYTGSAVPSADVIVPNVIGYSASQAKNVLSANGLNITFSGSYREGVSGAVASRQTPAAGEAVTPGTSIVVEFTHTDCSD